MDTGIRKTRLMHDRKQDWLVRNYVSFDVIQAEPSLLFLTQEDKRRLCSQGGVRLPKMGVTGDNSQRRLLGQHSDAMLEQCCN